MKKLIILILTAFMLISVPIILTGCGDNDYSAHDLQEAKGRVFSGKGSAQDKRMVKGFYKWKASQ